MEAAMARTERLTLAFLETHPDDAARVLERLDPVQAATLFDTLPARLAAPVLARMLSAYAARILTQMSDERATGLVRRLNTQAGAAVLRHLPGPQQRYLLKQLPTASSVAYRLLLAYPEDSVGALADLQVPAYTPESGAKEVLARLRHSTWNHSDFLYVVDPDKRLKGSVRLADLLHADGATSLSQIMSTPVPTLSALATLLSTAEHPGWNDYHALPVVDRHAHFVGALRHTALMQALAHLRVQAPDTAAVTGLLETLGGAYWFAVSNLLQVAVSALPGRGPGAESEERR